MLLDGSSRSYKVLRHGSEHLERTLSRGLFDLIAEDSSFVVGIRLYQAIRRTRQSGEIGLKSVTQCSNKTDEAVEGMINTIQPQQRM